MKYNRLLPLIIPLFVLILLELFYFVPKMIYISVLIICLLLFFTTRQFTKESKTQEKWWNFFILPALFNISLTVFSILIPNKFIVQIIFLIDVVFLYFYFRTIYILLIRKESFDKATLGNIFSYSNFLIIFFLSSSIYGLQLFLDITVWKLIAILLIVFILVVYQVVWVYNIEKNQGIFYIFLTSLVLTEIAWSLVFLPLSFYIIGLVLAIYYYIILGLIKYKLFDKLDKKTVKIYIIFGFTSIFILLLTARWL